MLENSPPPGTEEPLTPTPLPAGYRLLEEPPTSEEYVSLRRDSGLSPRTAAQAAGALSASSGTAPGTSTSPTSPPPPPTSVGDWDGS